MKQRAIEVLRWIAVVPAAVVAFITCSTLGYWVLSVLKLMSHTDDRTLFVPALIAAAMAAWLSVMAAAGTAPRFKWETAIGATVVVCLVAVVVVASGFVIEHDTPRWALTLYAVVCAAGAIGGCRQVREER